MIGRMWTLLIEFVHNFFHESAWGMCEHEKEKAMTDAALTLTLPAAGTETISLI